MMNKLSTQPYKGTRDYFPEDKRVQDYIFSVWKKVSESYGYENYGAPTIEPLELYAAKSGQEIVNEQTYTFIDRGGRTVAIRPEMTPSIGRMVAQRRQELAYPARLYSIANFMRYERPQRGREREFWQLNVDIFGADSIMAEAEIIQMSDNIMKAFGAKSQDYVIKINNRKLINFVMAQYLGLDVDQAQMMIKLFDRMNKITHEELVIQATEILGDEASGIGLEKIEALLSAKNMSELPSEILECSAVHEVQELFTILEHANVGSLKFDITLMRGFDYYTGMVFEVFDMHPDNSRALFGGGRYDGLVGLFGVEPISAVGFAPGGTMMELFLNVHGLMPVMNPVTDIYVAILGNVGKQAVVVADEFRAGGLNAELGLIDQKIDKHVKFAVKKQIPYILFIGEEELVSGIYPIKHLSDSKEYKLNIADTVALIKETK
jgi:histidyl-tRNA synthetase